MMESPWEIGYSLAHNDACFQISGNKMYTYLNLIISPSSFCFRQDKIQVILTSCPRWSYGPHQSFLLIILVFGMGIFVCLYLFMNFVLERTLKTNFPGTSLANCASVPLASLDSANFFDNLKTLYLFTLFGQSSLCCGEGNGNPLQNSCLENCMDRGGWWAIVHGVAKSQPWLSNCHSALLCLFILHALAEVLILWENLLPVIESVFLWGFPIVVSG